MSPLWIAVIFLASACHSSSGIPGGWTKQDPKADTKFLELAHYATSSQTEGRDYYDTVVELLEVETQVVAGLNYRLKMKIAPSMCKIAEKKYTQEECVPQEGVPHTVCTAVVYEVVWQNTRSITSFKCEV